MNKSHDDLPIFFPSFNGGAAIFASAPCAPCGSGTRPAASPLRGGVAPAPLRSNAGRSAPPRGGRGEYHGKTRDIFPIYHGNFSMGILAWEFYHGNLGILAWEFLEWEFYHGNLSMGIWEF